MPRGTWVGPWSHRAPLTFRALSKTCELTCETEASSGRRHARYGAAAALDVVVIGPASSG